MIRDKILGAEWSMPEDGITPYCDSEKPHTLVVGESTTATTRCVIAMYFR